MSEANSQLKERVRAFWQEHPCGTKFADAPPGSRRFYELVEEHRYQKEWHIPAAAGFAHAKNLRVLEVGCGLGTDGAQFAKAGADYTGIDLTEAAVDLAKRRFELFQSARHFPRRRRRTPRFPRQLVRPRLLARRAASHARHRRSRARDPSRAASRRQSRRHALSSRLLQLSRQYLDAAPRRRAPAEDGTQASSWSICYRRTGRQPARTRATVKTQSDYLSSKNS